MALPGRKQMLQSLEHRIQNITGPSCLRSAHPCQKSAKVHRSILSMPLSTNVSLQRKPTHPEKPTASPSSAAQPMTSPVCHQRRWKWMPFSLTNAPVPGNASSTASSKARTTAKSGADSGSTSSTMQTPPEKTQTTHSRICGSTGTGSSMPSIATCPTPNFSSISWPGT